MAILLAIDDKQDNLITLTAILKNLVPGCKVITAQSGLEGLEKAKAHSPDTILLDIKMPGMDGMEVLKHLRATYPETVVIMITGHPTIQSAVECTKLGALDYLVKPFRVDDLETLILKAQERAILAIKSEAAPEEEETVGEVPYIVGNSPAIREVFSTIRRAAPSDGTVLLTGESGTGKELVARAVHTLSDRANKEFVPVDCSALVESLLESELFGHEKGAFTGATDKKIGLIESANTGTLFIDEISELPLPLQTKLLRFLETGTYRTVGGNTYKQVDVRIIAATNRNLRQMVEDKKFRNDLFFRLTAFPVEIPPLRERKDDLPALAEHFLSTIEGGTYHIPLSEEVIEELLKYDYPGNVRELRNIMERACILASLDTMTPDHLIFEQFTYINSKSEVVSSPDQYSIPDSSDYDFLSRSQGRHDKDRILNALRQCNGNRSRAADLLGVSERTIYRYVKKLRAEMPDFADPD
ncbi:MAG: sigma-54-dependent Fis family transcriptional regulator [Gammaproteobacteria bacterium]|nr:sigma-54-dependent Fis family transcriptional regulator [Gammaproteobacteria bacterium]